MYKGMTWKSGKKQMKIKGIHNFGCQLYTIPHSAYIYPINARQVIQNRKHVPSSPVPGNIFPMNLNRYLLAWSWKWKQIPMVFWRPCVLMMLNRPAKHHEPDSVPFRPAALSWTWTSPSSLVTRQWTGTNRGPQMERNELIQLPMLIQLPDMKEWAKDQARPSWALVAAIDRTQIHAYSTNQPRPESCLGSSRWLRPTGVP